MSLIDYYKIFLRMGSIMCTEGEIGQNYIGANKLEAFLEECGMFKSPDIFRDKIQEIVDFIYFKVRVETYEQLLKKT